MTTTPVDQISTCYQEVAMQRGDVVHVRAYPDKVLPRVVWEVEETFVVVCRPEVYKRARASGTGPERFMGFPKEDVEPALHKMNGDWDEWVSQR